MDKLSGLINRRFRQILGKSIKWTVIVLGAALAGFAASQWIAMPMISHKLKPEDVKVVRNSKGQARTVYGEKKTPRTFDEEMGADAPQLIYQNQQRFYDDNASGEEDQPSSKAPVPAREQRRVSRATARFLRAWETFSAGDSEDRYRRRIAPYADAAGLDDLVERSDSIQRQEIRPGGQSGSHLDLSEADPAAEAKVLRFDEKTAYVSTTAAVTYTGPSLTWMGLKVRRSYGMVLTNTRDGWKVLRCAAQTLGEVIE